MASDEVGSCAGGQGGEGGRRNHRHRGGWAAKPWWRPLALFYLLTLMLSWSYWGILLAQGVRVGSRQPWPSHLPGLLGPCLAAVLVIAQTEGGVALRQWLIRLVWPVGVGWSGLAWALSPLLMAGAVYGALALSPLGPTLAWARWSEYPGLPADWPAGSAIGLAWGLNGCGEEGGWRGFAFDRLERRLGVWSACLWVAVLWMFWHVPLFFLTDNFRALWGWHVVGWALSLVCGSFVLGAIYVRSGRSAWAVATWHVLFNGAVATPLGQGLPSALMSTMVIVLGVMVAWRQWYVRGGSSVAEAENGNPCQAPSESPPKASR